MKVAVAQIEPKLAEKERNLEACLARLDAAAAEGAELLVLPECALPGYMFESAEEALPYAEEIPGPSTETLEGADIVAHPTNFPMAAKLQTELITVARAAENRIYLLTANRVGKERWGEFCGWSQIVDPFGKRLAEAGETEEALLVADVELEKARDKDYVVPGEYELYLFGHRRPELYGALVEETQAVKT